MKIWLDTEFNSWGGDLISIALVADDGKEFYEVLECINPCQWVAINVIPYLNKRHVSKAEAQAKLSEFLCQYKEVCILATWPDDFRLFMDMLIVGPGYKMNTPDITMKLLKPTKEGAAIMAKSTHNALDDAKLLRYAHP